MSSKSHKGGGVGSNQFARRGSSKRTSRNSDPQQSVVLARAAAAGNLQDAAGFQPHESGYTKPKQGLLSRGRALFSSKSNSSKIEPEANIQDTRPAEARNSANGYAIKTSRRERPGPNGYGFSGGGKSRAPKTSTNDDPSSSSSSNSDRSSDDIWTRGDATAKYDGRSMPW